MPIFPAALRAGDPRRAAFWDGVRTIAPSLLATGTWGLVTGVAMVKSGLGIWLSLVMTLLVFAGSAQLTALPLIVAHAPWWLILGAATVVNLRFVMFSAALHPFFRHLSFRRRLFLGYVTSDVGFVLFLPRYQDAAVKGTPEQLWFFLGGSCGNWVTWQLGSILGIALAARVPGAWSLEFAGTLALLVLAVPLVKGRPVIVAVATAAVVAWVGAHWPLRLGLVAAVAAGIVAGMLAEGGSKASGPPSVPNTKEPA